MALSSEFESLYHGLIYKIHHHIQTSPKAWKDLSNALYAYCDDLEFELPDAFADALLDDSSENPYRLFQEIRSPNTEKDSYYITAYGSLPYIDFSQLEKHYLSYVLDRPETSYFLKPETLEHLKSRLPDNLLGDCIKTINQPEMILDAIDIEHLNLMIDAIQSHYPIDYVYIDDEGIRYETATQPLLLEYQFQTHQIYVMHQPLGDSKQYKSLLKRFEWAARHNNETLIPTLDAVQLNGVSSPSFTELQTAQSNLVLQVPATSDALRQIFVELAVYERVIYPENNTYKIVIRIFPDNQRQLLRSLLKLQPYVTVLEPQEWRESIISSLHKGLNLLQTTLSI